MSGLVAGRHLIHVGQLRGLDGLVGGAGGVVVGLGGEGCVVGAGCVGDVVVVTAGVVVGGVVGGGLDQVVVQV